MKAICAMIMATALTAPLIAHHSIAATFDESKVTTLRGVITKIEWGNPHVNFTMEVKDPNGEVTTWHVGIASPNALYLDGFRKETIEVMKTYSVVIWPARDGSHFGTGQTVTFADGRIFDVHDRWGDMEFQKGTR